MTTSDELGTEAYQKGLWGDYRGAIAILDKALAKHPFDVRLYNARSYYNYKLTRYESALADAETMLKLFPPCARAYFRKGEALMELKRYEEAEQVFRHILVDASTNEEARFYLLEAQLCQLTENKEVWVTHAKRALELNNYNTKQAKAFLTVGGMNGVDTCNKEDLYFSDDDVNICLTPSDVPSAPFNSAPEDYDPLTDTNNPLNSSSLWVGRIPKAITEKKLKSIFSKYGVLKNIVIQREKGCAFVNYVLPGMASDAMKFTQNMKVDDTFLLVRFPNAAKAKRLTANVCNNVKKITKTN